MMAFIRNSLVLAISLLMLMAASNAKAQIRPGAPIGGGGATEERVRILESRVGQLEASLYQINQRLAAVESNQRPQPYPYPTQPTEQACLLTDSLVYKVSLGKGRTRLEAEANARTACASNVHASYCQAAVKCTDERDAQIRQGAICILKDTLLSKTYKGEAKTFIEAEFQARKACGESVHGSYCKADVRCEAY